MGLHIDYIDETESLDPEQLEMVQKLLEFAFTYQKLDGDAELSLSFVNNEQIRDLNRIYRGKDQPTDVLSFALEETMEDETGIIGVDMPRILGDIIISVPKAKSQAEEYGHSFERELGFLAVHGFLHLLGYDHQTDEEEKEMFGIQEEILKGFGLTR